jgi:hypothetical protein
MRAFAAAAFAQNFLGAGVGARLAAARAELVDEIALAARVVGGLRDDRNGNATCSLRLVDGLIEPVLTATYVEAEDQRVIDLGTHHVEGRIGKRAVDQQRAECLAGAGHADGSRGIDQRQRPDRRHHNRQSELVAEERGRRVDARHIA